MAIIKTRIKRSKNKHNKISKTLFLHIDLQGSVGIDMNTKESRYVYQSTFQWFEIWGPFIEKSIGFIFNTNYTIKMRNLKKHKIPNFIKMYGRHCIKSTFNGIQIATF